MNPLITKKTLEIELLDNCNLNCKLCHRIHFKRTTLELDIKTILKTIADNNYERVQLMGTRSEPTLYSNFIELIIELQKNNIEIELYTNGSTSNKFWKSLSEIINNEFIIMWCISGVNEEDHFNYRNSSLNKLLTNVKTIPNALNFGLFILFDFNTKEFSNPIKDTELIKLDSKIKNNFDGILYIHSGDVDIKDELKTQNIKKFILPFNKQCIGTNINFLSMEGKLFECKYKYEATQELGYIPEDICKNCNITFLPKIQDRFILDSKIIFKKDFNNNMVFNIPYYLERKNNETIKNPSN